MCEICRQFPCNRHCPNSQEKPMYTCDCCGGEIYKGDYYYQIAVEGYPTQILCEDCIEESKRCAEEDE